VNRNINPANAVTASRFLTLPPFVYFIDQGLYQWALVTALLCGVLDLFDGALARIFDCSTPFGEVFDAIADGFCYGFMIIVLTVYERVPLAPVVLIIGMGTVNAVFRAIYARRAGRTTNYRSFAMERVVAYTAYLVGFGVSGYQVDYFYWGCAAVMAVVLIHDAKRMLVDPVPADAAAAREAARDGDGDVPRAASVAGRRPA
jgi:phosphatidylglycerophosphate synthase